MQFLASDALTEVQTLLNGESLAAAAPVSHISVFYIFTDLVFSGRITYENLENLRLQKLSTLLMLKVKLSRVLKRITDEGAVYR